MTARRRSGARPPRVAASVAAGAMLVSMGFWLSPSAASESPSAEPTTTSEDDHSNPDFTPPETVDTYVGQSVQARKTADGVQNAHLANFRWAVTQVNAESLNGLDVSVPLPMDDAPGLRSLTGRSNSATEVDGGVLYNFNDVNGVQNKRTLNLFPQDRELPVDVRAEFTLDGETVNAADIVGKGGLVTAKYTIVNKSVKNQSVNFENVSGEPDVADVDTSQAFVGISKQFIPQSWGQFDPGHGIFGADGRGNYQTQWITLAFLPFAEGGEASFGWSAVIPDGQGFIPKMVIEVSPLYVPAHSAEEEEAAEASDSNGVPMPNLDPATATVQAGVKQLISGLQGIAALLPEKDPNAPSLIERLGTLQKGLTTLSTELGTLENALKDAIGAAPAPIDPATVQGYIDQIDAAIAAIDSQIAAINEELNRKEDGPQAPGATCASNPPAAYCTVLEDTKKGLQETKVQLQAAKAALGQIQAGGGAAITEEVLTAILTKVTAAKTTVDGLLTTLTNLLNTIATASDLAAQAASGKAQISTGLGMASDEVSAYIAKVAAAAQQAAAEGKNAAEEVKASLNETLATLAGLKERMTESPLPYSGGFNTAYGNAGDADAVQTASEAMLPNNTLQPVSAGVAQTRELFGAYQFMLDPADSNKPNTPWRVLLAVLFVVGAGFLGKRVASRRNA